TLLNTYTVTNLADSGPGSLRQAVLDVNAHHDTDQIVFAPGLHGTIALTSGELNITDDDLTITGPGANQIAVSGTDASRVFAIAAGVTAEIDALTITHGRATQGGGIDNAGSLTLSHCTLSENQAINNSGNGSGGGIFNESGAALLLRQSTLAHNLASGSAGSPLNPGGRGGGLANRGAGTIADSTLTQNVALGGFRGRALVGR